MIRGIADRGGTGTVVATLWRADRRRSLVVAICVLASGVLPAILMVLTGRVIAAI